MVYDGLIVWVINVKPTTGNIWDMFLVTLLLSFYEIGKYVAIIATLDVLRIKLLAVKPVMAEFPSQSR